MRRALIVLAVLLAALPVLPQRSTAVEPTDLLLVLAVDVSRSIDQEEWKLQRDGYINALTNPRVIDAIQSGPNRRIAIAYLEWAGETYQRVLVDWRLVDGLTAAEAFVSALAEFPYTPASWTSISGGIDYSVKVLERAPFSAPRRVIDVSGDGRNNHGRPASFARDDAVKQGITINGLPIVNDRANFGRPAERDLDQYYEREVIGGPGAFLVLAVDFKSFGDAILSKLIKEIAWVPPGDPGRLAQRP
jgi:hypothetical protein